VTPAGPAAVPARLPAGARIAWHFDFISPYSYLQLAAHPDLFELPGLELKPVLFAGLLAHWGNKGPVEIPEKRRQTYRMVAFNAARRGIALRFPPGHPFNPVAVLRLAIALGATGPMLPVVRTIFEFIWKEGRSASAQWPQLCARLGVDDADALIGTPAVKAQLRANGEEAIARGIYGVPTFAVTAAGAARAELFWGEDATDMLRAWLADPGLFDSAPMRALDALPVEAARKGA
jgi:2-hydroxychromene-2-carboxylate isomerase